MDLDPWRSMGVAADRYATVAIDSSRERVDADDELKLRWKGVRQDLVEQGAPSDLLDQMEDRLWEPDGRGGAIGRLLVGAVEDGHARVVADVGLPDPPSPEVSRWCPVPDVMPLVRACERHPAHLQVVVDRAGGTVRVHDVMGRLVTEEHIAGEHDVLHKVRTGDASEQRLQRRAEDSWERNAAEVARRVEELARERRPRLILLRGDEWATSAFRTRLSPDTRKCVVSLTAGREADTVRDALDTAVAERAQQALSQFVEEEGRQDRAVQGREHVAEALRRGQVSHLLLSDPGPRAATLRIGPDGLTTDDGTGEPVDADVALAAGAMITGSAVVLVPDDVPLTDGVGAVLRWSDASTPHDLAPSMPGYERFRSRHR